jgi:hypothetical protein
MNYKFYPNFSNETSEKYNEPKYISNGNMNMIMNFIVLWQYINIIFSKNC